jgi:hypothetical protein
MNTGTTRVAEAEARGAEGAAGGEDTADAGAHGDAAYVATEQRY